MLWVAAFFFPFIEIAEQSVFGVYFKDLVFFLSGLVPGPWLKGDLTHAEPSVVLIPQD